MFYYLNISYLKYKYNIKLNIGRYLKKIKVI